MKLSPFCTLQTILVSHITNEEISALQLRSCGLESYSGELEKMFKTNRIRTAAKFAALALTAAILPNAHADLIVDGSFETATNGGASSFQYNATSPNWTFAATSGIIVPPSAFGAPTTGFDGNQVAFLQSNLGDSHALGQLGSISQNITIPAGVYQFSTLEAFRDPAAQYGVTIGGQTLVKHSAPTNAFTTNTFKFIVTPNLSGAQAFALKSTGPSDSTTFLDKVSITPSTSSFSTRTFSGDADSGISSAKTYTHAVNLNGNNVTVNGVTFTGGGVAGANYALTTTAAVSQSFHGNTTNVTGSAHDLLTDFFYDGTETLTLTGLTPGTTYTTTLYNSAFGTPGGRWATITDSLGNSVAVDENNSDANNGNLIQDTYTADLTGTVAFTFLPTSPGDTYHMYAFSNEVVAAPEPGSMALLGIAAAGLLRRRRR